MRKILGFSRQEWEDLPWHDQRMYLEQLACDPEYNDEAEENEAAVSSAYEISSFDDLPD